MSLSYWFSASQGRRPTMEDIHITKKSKETGWILCAICDGHGGDGVVKATRKLLPDFVFGALRSISSSSKTASLILPRVLKNKLTACILKLDRELYDTLPASERESGCTLVMFLYHVHTRQYVLVNLGDSRAVYRSCQDKRIVETKDHKPMDHEEFLRAKHAGLPVKNNRVGGILALSRAIGDFSLKRNQDIPYDPIEGAVSAVPEIIVGVVNSGGADVVLGCDGIFDVITSKEVIHAVINNTNNNTDVPQKTVQSRNSWWSFLFRKGKQNPQASKHQKEHKEGKEPKQSGKKHHARKQSNSTSDLLDYNPARNLVVRAYQNDSTDNMSVIVIKVAPKD